MGFVSENLGTIVIAAILAGAVVCIVMNLVKRKKSGKSSCGCNCGDCPMHSGCHKE